MNILPKQYSDFQTKTYWDQFFQKLKEQKDESNQFFEWYGNFKEYDSVLNQFLDKNQKILNIGCGNSLFSEEMYDSGFKNIINNDFSENIINEMSQRSLNIRPFMKYEVMDVYNMTYQPESFDIIIDKGLLDAIYPVENEENNQKITNLFNDFCKILTNKEYQSRYICISLLQSHVLNILLEFFQPRNYQITIYEILIENSKIFPFMVDIQKSKNKNNKIELQLRNKIKQQFQVKDLKFQIRKIQTQNRYIDQVNVFHPGQRFQIEIWDNKNNKNSEIPKYTLTVVDSLNKKILDNKTCGCFITPQGKEQDFLFSSEKGNFQLLEQVGFSRLIIAILNPGFSFGNLQAVQGELSPAVDNLTPKGCKNKPVPFLTDGDQIGKRNALLENNEFIIDEIMNENNKCIRRLIFKNNIQQIQSQFQIIYFSNKNKPQLVEINKQFQSILPPKKNVLVGIDDTHLEFESHKQKKNYMYQYIYFFNLFRAIFAGFSLFNFDQLFQKEFNILVIGCGLCALSKFIYNYLQHVKLINIDISKNVIETAKNFFEVPVKDPRFKLIIDNGVQYVKSLPVQEDFQQQEQQKQNQPKSFKQFNTIIIDVFGFENQPSPPEGFQSVQFLEKAKKLLHKEQGILMINFIGIFENQADQFIQQNLVNIFEGVYSFKSVCQLSEYNYVIFCVNGTKNLQQKTLEENFKKILARIDKNSDCLKDCLSICQNIQQKHYSDNVQKQQQLQQ
ncbi:hypothetical protein IMG5_190700 [Ichthyophthirius multifiliis]|uniref:Cyclic nucleotide-binding domain-containing protein n=1 Tax=Ichthyophthirius multifiliis TaxID=5932 RepID=G0R4A3_ICHMU|nr:hypothetical protein IMG5_190700 [Ichthyophthirius multifiliis]EGR27714.1 hypothetical protein IMG5_190700 [Ichthyophthirius multifiliis]|eukprot:XP_004025166.1 hypothetical protein IMG5_190700 [Ichthyophthirius multifiliis]